jgi:hypothetical protein
MQKMIVIQLPEFLGVEPVARMLQHQGSSTDFECAFNISGQ